MNAQEIFDKVSTHLLTQGRQSKNAVDGSSCWYLSLDGTRCAIGILIDAKDLTPIIEGCTIKMVLRLGYLRGKKYGYMNRLIYLLTTLQLLHDDSSNWLNKSTLYNRLAEVALSGDLSTETLERTFKIVPEFNSPERKAAECHTPALSNSQLKPVSVVHPTPTPEYSFGTVIATATMTTLCLSDKIA